NKLDVVTHFVGDLEVKTINPSKCPKLFLEEIAQDIHKTDSHWGITVLKYFNPVGIHEISKIGEDPKGVLNNLNPCILQVTIEIFSELNVVVMIITCQKIIQIP
ncbi:unnamed protein product, partial [Ilex paraguariensis]